MRRPSLTQPPSREHVDEVSGEAETVTAYEWGGAAVWVRDSAMRALRVIELFVDESVEPEQKALWLPHMMFPVGRPRRGRGRPPGHGGPHRVGGLRHRHNRRPRP